MHRPLASHLVGLILSVVLASGSVGAIASDWVPTTLRGTVLIIDGREWREVEPHDVVSSASAIRALQSGRLVLGSAGDSIQIGPRTTIELFTSPDQPSTLLRQYSGTVTLKAGGTSAALTLEAVDYVVVPLSGTVTIEVEDDTARISVSGGIASVTDRNSGKTVHVTFGETYSGSAAGGALVTAATGSSAGGGPGADSGGGAPGDNGIASSGGNNSSSGSNNASSGSNNASSGGNNASSGGNNGSSGNASSGGSASSSGAGSSTSSGGSNASGGGDGASSGGSAASSGDAGSSGNASSGGSNASGGGDGASSGGGNASSGGNNNNGSSGGGS
jgi:hypothetical protein